MFTVVRELEKVDRKNLLTRDNGKTKSHETKLSRIKIDMKTSYISVYYI